MQQDPKTLFKFKLDKADATLGTGDDFNLFTDLITDATGATRLIWCQVLSRADFDDVVEYTAREGAFSLNYANIMPNTANDYGSATQDEKDTGGYILDASDPNVYLIL